MLVQILFAFMSIFTIAWSIVTSPMTFRCPGTTAITTVRSSGQTGCALAPVGTENDGESRPGEILGRVYCTGGSVPIWVNHRTAGCMRRAR